MIIFPRAAEPIRIRSRLFLTTALTACVVGTIAFAQEPAKTAAPAPTQEPAAKVDEPKPAEPQTPKAVGDLTARYRFQERFTNQAGNLPFGVIGQYQAAFRETTVSDTSGTAKSTRVVQAIFTERPVEVSPVDERKVTDSIRHYSKVNITPDPWKDRKDQLPLKDLTIWYRELASEAPLVLVLTPGRSLLEEEYKFAISYNFVSDLAYLLPDAPVRIGDKWKVGRDGAAALMNNGVMEGTLTGKLTEILVHPKDPKLRLAVINITGKVVTGIDKDVYDTAVNARVDFAFLAGSKDNTVIDASGAIEKVLLAEVSNLRIPIPGQTQTRTTKRDLVFEMKRPGAEPLIAIPNPRPKATPENSWLTYHDAKNRFHLRHPQGFEPVAYVQQPNRIDLRHYLPDRSFDVVQIEFVEKPGERPEKQFAQLTSDWAKQGFDVQLGVSERLPDVEWPNMAVNHMEAALNYSDPQGRPLHRFFDAYFLQFARDVTLRVSATTFQDQPEAFRAQVLSLLKTAKLGPPVTK
jgi:hypothetical protein